MAGIKRGLKKHQIEDDMAVSGATSAESAPAPEAAAAGGSHSGRVFTQRTMSVEQHKAEQDKLNTESEKKYQEYRAGKYKNR